MMSLFGAARKTSTFQKAKKRMEKAEAEFGTVPDVSANDSVSSGIGAQMIIARNLQRDSDGTATTSEIAREELGEYLGQEQPVW